MYPWEDINVEEDSTLRIIHESVTRGHNTAIIHHDDLVIKDTTVFANCHKILKSANVPANLEKFYKSTKFKEQILPLRGFDVLFLRSNPPIDNIMLNFLDPIKDEVFIVNDIDGLRRASNKVYPASLDDPDHKFIPRTIVSQNKKYLKQEILDYPGEKMIMKPLDGYGGSGVIILEKSAMNNINSLLEFYIDRDNKKNYVIVQEYAEGADKGDVRVLMINGEPVGSMRRVPAEGENRSNVHAGGSVVKHTLTKKERELCKEIGKKLVEDGLYFVGLDLIGGKLIEVNVCSPGGIPWVNKNMRTKIQSKLLDFAEGVVKVQEAIINRRQQYRKAVQDA